MLMKKKSKKTKGRARDYAKIHALYMESDILEVEVFFKEFMGFWDGACRDKTIGWRAEKDRMREAIYQARQKEIQENKQKVLSTAMNNAIAASSRKLQRAAQSDFADIGEVKIAWGIIRTESGLPTNITHNTNVNTNEQRDVDAAAKLREKLGLDKEASESPEDATVKSANIVTRGNRKSTKKESATK